MLKTSIYFIVVMVYWLLCQDFTVTYHDGHIGPWPLHAKLITTFMVAAFTYGALTYKEKRNES